MVVEEWKKCGIATIFPTYRKSGLITTESWLAGKREDDQAEGLWRIYDTINDVTDFIDKHPGGSFWLRETKGTDITEAFEAHHISSAPEKLLEKYKVREAKNPRIYTLTLKEDGFYKTLKRRVREKLQTVDMQNSKNKSDLIHNILLASIFIFAWLALKYNSAFFVILTGAVITWTSIVAHNYFHRRDNWRMYTFNLSMMNFVDWRILHALSHHIYPNTYFDLELSLHEPFFCWVPNPYIKSVMMRYLSWLYAPVMYIIGYYMQVTVRLIYSFQKTNIMFWHDFIPFILPLFLYMTTGAPVLLIVKKWMLMIIASSFIFHLIGLNAAHHDPKIYHEGDATRVDRDWGLFEVDTIIERTELTHNIVLALTHFGDHSLHHLFPTLDHSVLPFLHSIFYETLEEFKGQAREQSILAHIIGQHKQLVRTAANPVPNGS